MNETLNDPRQETTTPRRGRPPTVETVSEPVNGSEPKKMKPELQRDIEVAEEAQRQLIDTLTRRAKSPEGLSVGIFQEKDPLKALQIQYCPDAVDKIGPDGKRIRGTKSTFLDEPGEGNSNHERHLAEGWVPVVNGRKEQVRYGACYMYERPRAISDAQLLAVSQRSKRRLQAMDAAMQKANEEAKRETGSRSVLEDATTVTQGSSS